MSDDDRERAKPIRFVGETPPCPPGVAPDRWAKHWENCRRAEDMTGIAVVQFNEFDAWEKVAAMLMDLLAAGRAKSLVWTSEPPTVPGWYWYRASPDKEVVMADVQPFNGELAAEMKPAAPKFMFDSVSYYRKKFPGCQWAGPIPLPQEPPR